MPFGRAHAKARQLAVLCKEPPLMGSPTGC